MSDKVRVGVIGLSMGSTHVTSYKAAAEAELVGLCDRDEAWLRHIQGQSGAPKIYTKYEDLLADPDIQAVSVCLPTWLHAPTTIAALKAGKHVLCEKPMATSARDAQAMADAAKEAGKVLMISHNQRFQAQAQCLKRTVARGDLGRIYFVRAGWRRPMGRLPLADHRRATGGLNRNWFCERAKGGGALFDLGSHMLDLSLWMLDFPKIKTVAGINYSMFLPAFSASSGQPGDAEDLAAGMYFFENDASLQFEVSFGTFIEQETVFLELYGTAGGASLRGGVLKLFGEREGGYSNETMRGFNIKPQTSQENFLRAILSGEAPLITAEQGVAVTTALERLRDCGLVKGDPKGKVYGTMYA